jgi:hypothetical protein
MFFSRLCDFLRITIAIYFLSNGRVAIAPNADEANCIDQASSLLKRPSSSNDGNPQKQEWYSASQTSHSDGSSGNPPDGGWPRILPPNHDGMQLDLPGNRNQIPIDDPNHVVIDPPFQIVVTGSIRNADMPREQITAWEHHFSHFIEFYWAPSTRKPIRQPSSTTFSNWPAATVSFIHRNSQPVELIIPLTSDGKIYEKSSLVERITELQKWLLYTHKIVLQLLHPELKPDDWIDFHRDLVIKWFFEELFKPTHGLPVFGPAKPIDGANEPFGRLQSYVFKLLQNKASVSMASVAIVGSWHKRRDHAAWQYLFNNDHEFWEAVAQSMIREANDPINDESNIHLTLTLKGHPASTVGTSPGGPSSLTISDDKIGNFKFHGPDQLDVENLHNKNHLRWLRHLPDHALTGPRRYGSDYGTKILQISSDYHHDAVFSHAKVLYRFPNVGIAIEARDKMADIRVMSSSQFMLPRSHVQNQIQRLVKHLETVSQDTFALIDDRFHRGFSPLWMKLHEEFLKWFGVNLLGQDVLQHQFNGQRKFPIVGRVVTSRIKVDQDPPYDSAQLFIINVLSNTESRLWDASLVLFGYWLKNESKPDWNFYFKTDEFFSYFMRRVSERSLRRVPDLN